MEQFKHKFIEEATDLILDLEKSSLELSADPTNTTHIEVIFRAMHSLKGGSAMFGFDKIDAFTHNLESVYDQVRKGQRNVNESLLDITFQSIDHIKILLLEDDQLSDKTLQNHNALLNSINALVNNNTEFKGKTGTSQEDPSLASPELATYYIKFKPLPHIFRNGTNPLLIVNELVSLGDAKVHFITEDIPEFSQIDVLSCYSSWTIILSTDVGEEEIRDVFMFVDHDCELVINKLSEKNLLRNSEFSGKITEAFENNMACEVEDIEKIFNSCMVSVTEKKNGDGKEHISRSREQNISSIRVSSEKLDELINLVSELVTRQAGLTLISESLNNKDLQK